MSFEQQESFTCVVVHLMNAHPPSGRCCCAPECWCGAWHSRNLKLSLCMHSCMQPFVVLPEDAAAAKAIAHNLLSS